MQGNEIRNPLAVATPSLGPFVGSIVGLANVLWIFVEEKRRRHDLMTDTIVVIA